jgi:type 1 glutamine amidotransferase/lysophospholipase L1-like esterase
MSRMITRFAWTIGGARGWLIALAGAMTVLFAPSASGVRGDEGIRKSHVVFVIGEPEYHSEQTLPRIAQELAERYGMRTTVLTSQPSPENAANIPGLQALDDADLACFFMRWRELPEDQVAHIQKYLDAGKPVVGLRTTTHGFRYPKGHELERWNDFGPDVLGAPWIYHYGHDSSTDVAIIPEAAAHPILTGIPTKFHVRSWLYQVRPDYPPGDSQWLLLGTSVGPSDRKDREQNPVAWTRKTKAGGRVFTTTMGHPADFEIEAFHRLLINGIHWALGRPVPGARESTSVAPSSSSSPSSRPRGFELVDGDRVVLVGNTFIERESYYGYLETSLTARYPGRRISFRNLGWAGDTVTVQPRPLNFGDLMTHVSGQQPTVLFVGYGMNESFDGLSGLDSFLDGYQRILDKLAETKARMVLISPIQHEDLGRPLPDPTEHNRNIALYMSTMRSVAEKRGLPFFDLYEMLSDSSRSGPRAPLTDDGIHLTQFGYWRAGQALERGLGMLPPEWNVELSAAGQVFKTVGTKPTDVQSTGQRIRFIASDSRLPAAPLPPGAPEGAWKPGRLLRVTGLAAGRHALTIDNKPVISALAERWAEGVELRQGPEFDQVEKLRATIVHKNRLFFFRWRAHNGEYIYGRRAKAFDGNAGNEQFPSEMAHLDSLIADDEEAIAKLALPAAHTYELAPQR